MKIEVNTKELKTALSLMSMVASDKYSMAILKHIKFTVKGLRVKIEATNVDTTIVDYIDAINSDSDGSFLCEGKTLTKLIDKINTDNVVITFIDNSVEVSTKKTKVTLGTDAVENYPAIQDIEYSDNVVLQKGLFCDTIKKASSFIGTTDFRPILNQIYCELKGGTINVYATDTHCLFFKKYDIQDIANISFFIAPSALNLIQKIATIDTQDSISIFVSDKTILYQFKDIKLYTSVLVGKYPQADKVVAQSFALPHKFSVNKKDMEDSLSRLSLCTDQTNFAKFEIDENNVMLAKSEDLMWQKKNTEEIEVTADASIIFGMNIESFKRIFGAVDEDNINIYFRDAAFQFAYINDDKSNVVMAMPMQIKEV